MQIKLDGKEKIISGVCFVLFVNITNYICLSHNLHRQRNVLNIEGTELQGLSEGTKLTR